MPEVRYRAHVAFSTAFEILGNLEQVHDRRKAFVYVTTIETFISKARMNPSRTLVTGAICGVRVDQIEDPMMQGVRYLDKLIDELAKGRPMEEILRKANNS